MSAVRDCLLDLFAAALHIGGRSSIRNLRTRHAMVTGTHKHRIKGIRNIKNGKTPGIDSVTVELIKNGVPELLQRIFDLLIQIWDQETCLKNGK